MYMIGDEQAIVSNPINYTEMIIVNEKFSEYGQLWERQYIINVLVSSFLAITMICVYIPTRLQVEWGIWIWVFTSGRHHQFPLPDFVLLWQLHSISSSPSSSIAPWFFSSSSAEFHSPVWLIYNWYLLHLLCSLL